MYVQYVCMEFTALITTLVLCARSQDSILYVSVRRILVVFSTVLDLWAEESRVLRHVKPPRCGEASRKPRLLSRFQTEAIGTLAHGFYPMRGEFPPCTNTNKINFETWPRALCRCKRDTNHTHTRYSTYDYFQTYQLRFFHRATRTSTLAFAMILYPNLQF